FLKNGTGLVDFINEEIRKGSQTISFAIKSFGKDTTDNMWIGGIANGNYNVILDCKLTPKISRYAIDDAIVMQAFPDSVIDQSKTGGNIYAFRKKNVGGTFDQTFSYVKFDISDLAGTQIESATLSYRGKTGDANFADLFKLALYTVTQDWKGDTVKWKTKPATGSSKLDTSFLNTSSARKEFLKNGTGLVDFINEEIRKGSKTVSLAIKSFGKDSTDNMWIGGSANGSYGPILNITVTPNKSKYSIDDAIVMQAFPDSVIDQSKVGGNILAFRKKNAGGTFDQTFSYIKFDISDLAGTQIESATISYRGKTGDANYANLFKLGLYTVTQNWIGDTVKWKTKPATGSTKLDTSFLNTSSARKEFLKNGTGLVDYINEEIRKGSKTISFAIKSFGKDSTDNMWIGGTSNGNYGPILNYTIKSAASNYSIDDAIVMQAFPDSVIDQSKTGGNIFAFRKKNAGGTFDQTFSYIKFDLSGLRDHQIEQATVSYRGKTGDANFADLFKLALYTVTQNWTGDTVKWKTKPTTGSSKLDTSFLNTSSARKEFLKNGTGLVDFINEELRKGNKTVSLAIKSFGKDSTENMWIGGTANGNYGPIINFVYVSEVGKIPPTVPLLSPSGGTFVPQVKIMLQNKPAKDTVRYEIGKNNVPDPTITSPIFPDEGLLLTADTTVIKVRGFRDGLLSSVVSGTYYVKPIGDIVFDPSPLVNYQKKVVVRITCPYASWLYYSDDGSDPSEPVPDSLILTKTTTLKVKAYNNDLSYSVTGEATYKVVITQDLPGTGPGGVGFMNLTRENQPELSLWLKPEKITGVNEGEEVKLWPDASGNNNNAINNYSVPDQNIPNTGEKNKPAPVYISSALNGFPALNFGMDKDNTKLMLVPDADNLDGGTGNTIFLVFKRNMLYGDFAALIQKRDISGSDPTKQAYVLEMDGGVNPNKMQYVIARDVFLKNGEEFGIDKYYIVNVNMNSSIKLASFFTDGKLQNTNFYNKPIQATDAPVLIAGFQPMNYAEIVYMNSDVNTAQLRIVNNYLAAKYGLTLTDGTQTTNLYTNEQYYFDVIGIGKENGLTGGTYEHLYSSGGALEIKASSLANSGDYVFAGHSGIQISEQGIGKLWSRDYFLQVTGTNPDITLGFNFAEAGLSTIPDNTYKLFYRALPTDDWTDLGLTPTYDAARKVLKFQVPAISTGYYTIGMQLTSVGKTTALNGIFLYPNPATDKVHLVVRNDQTGPVDIRISDVSGKIIQSETVFKYGPALNYDLIITSMEKGTYFVEIRTGNTRTIKYFIRK
ncbi:MAG: DNRLRE domain-containing protein, partial [Bacteroidales bacterium]